MQDLTSSELLSEAKQAFANFRFSVVSAMSILWKIYETEAWRGVTDSFGDYVEQELKISQSFASKLITVFKHYCLEGGVQQQRLVGIDYEKLYLASKLGGSPDEQLQKATVLSRRDLKEVRNEEKPHEHEPILICKVCSIRL